MIKNLIFTVFAVAVYSDFKEKKKNDAFYTN